MSISKAIGIILGVKTDAKVSENDPRRNQKMHFMSTFLARFGYRLNYKKCKN